MSAAILPRACRGSRPPAAAGATGPAGVYGRPPTTAECAEDGRDVRAQRRRPHSSLRGRWSRR